MSRGILVIGIVIDVVEEADVNLRPEHCRSDSVSEVGVVLPPRMARAAATSLVVCKYMGGMINLEGGLGGGGVILMAGKQVVYREYCAW